MSAVAKGNAFENRVFTAITDELNGDRLGLSPKLASLFQKKGYYSRDRDSDIIVDISIEVWLPNADQWSLLWVCECKDYSSAIPVDDVEEIQGKTRSNCWCEQERCHGRHRSITAGGLEIRKSKWHRNSAAASQ